MSIQFAPVNSILSTKFRIIHVLLGDNYALKMRFVDHVYDDMVIDEAVVKVILPEGSK